MERKEAALEAFQEGYNCTQAVLVAFAADLDMPPDAATRLGEGFGGTTCNCGMPCGALLGAIMGLGLYAGRREAEDWEASGRVERLRLRLSQAFENRFGAIECRTLLGADITTETGFMQARNEGRFLRCGEYVEGAAVLLDALLQDDGALSEE